MKRVFAITALILCTVFSASVIAQQKPKEKPHRYQYWPAPDGRLGMFDLEYITAVAPVTADGAALCLVTFNNNTRYQVRPDACEPLAQALGEYRGVKVTPSAPVMPPAPEKP